MNLTINKKYMILPASFNAQKKRLFFYDGDRLVYDLVVSLDYDAPDYRFPVDMERFSGKTLRVECDKDIDINIEMSDKAELDYSGKYRPLAHFTSKRGWLNDPNGLVYIDGKYLMYYQHNPAATTWENMHWGSAVSADLIHWEENGDVMFPDENGTVFSGSAIVDKRNVTGLKNGENDVVLFFYTCAGSTSETAKGKPFTQNLAYSTDGGKTLVRYEKTLIEQIVGGNRDPQVIYYEQDNCYIMTLYLEEHEFVLFKSENLLDWKEIQRVTLPEDAECPDFYPLEVAGENTVKWVFSAASDRYFIGSFDGNKFTPESEQQRINYGNNSYAAQSWSDTPDGRRIRTAFATVVIPGMPFGSCMNIPQEMSLRRVNQQLKLCAKPVDEIKSLYTGTKTMENIHVNNDNPVKYKVNSKACDIELKVVGGVSFRISLFGMDIEYSAAEKQLKIGEQSAPVTRENGTVTLRMVFDTVYAEIFADSGSVFMGMTYIQDSLLNTLEISAEEAVVEELTISEMGNFYKR